MTESRPTGMANSEAQVAGHRDNRKKYSASVLPVLPSEPAVLGPFPITASRSLLRRCADEQEKWKGTAPAICALLNFLGRAYCGAAFISLVKSSCQL
ncbi:hypothetical protein [Sphingomonas sp. Leaf242]|uniref:hypothetical protein n=1 Tax=Sphingomonas sp. Leaf242 TaxID=1736304 RepID=UPI0012E15E00|nr:hypothetical protein [Sphingomonas sp. Leaf242]